jgi:glutaconyl-CoA/methylmalonyl-CoA decarboxylase subunit gamma
VKKYNIKVNGKQYEVEVELAETQTPSAAMTMQAQPRQESTAAVPVREKTAEPAGITGSIKIESPMPGTILKVSVRTGDKVVKAQVLCILEAMKMENEICAPQDGTVASVNVSAGDTVEAGTLLASLN